MRLGPSGVLWVTLCALLVVVGLGTVSLMLWETRKLQSDEIIYLLESRDGLLAELDALRAREAALEADLSRAQDEVAARQRDIESLRTEFDETLIPIEVGNSADFPIERAMAKPGETVTAFAERQGTEVGVLHALNPWLGEDPPPLERFQTLWIPITSQ